MNRYPNNHSDFFVAGGTLSHNSASYVKRPADDELFNLVLAGTFCYVLAPRQMGKSSLMIHTANRLRAQGVKTAVIDLTSIGPVSVDQWYLGLLSQLKQDLRLAADLIAWWEARARQSLVGRFVDFLRDVVLQEIKGQIVIFIDEIDVTLKLEFRDDFFAAIRAMYNARAHDPKFERLTFVLLGVATPPELIKERTRTPFNIGWAIVLEEFRRSEAIVLQKGLEALYPGQGKAIFDRIYDWTSGHPYLTQKLCWQVANNRNRDWHWSDKQIDRLVFNLFLKNGTFKDNNLHFVQYIILNSAQKHQLLNLYQKVYRGKKVSNDAQLIIQNQLKLSGLVKVENEILKVRNEIYRHVFDLAWVKEHNNIQGVFPFPKARHILRRRISDSGHLRAFLLGLLIGLIAVYGWLKVQAQNGLDATLTLTPTQMLTSRPSPTLTLLAEVTPNLTPSATAGAVAGTPSVTKSPVTVTSTRTATPTNTATGTPKVTNSPVTVTSTRTATPTNTATGTPKVTKSPVTATSTRTVIPSATPTVIPSATPLPSPRAASTSPTATFVPPTAILVPQTATFVPPTATFVLPTATFVPTNTPFVPSNTPLRPTSTRVPANTPLPTPTNTPTRYASPVLLAPEDHFVISERTLLQWSWNGTLQADEYFEVRVWREGDLAKGIAWTKETSYLFDPTIARAGGYFWSIAVIRGENGQWLADLSDPATPRTLYIDTEGGSQDPGPPPTGTAPP